jgi:hypothetical protein
MTAAIMKRPAWHQVALAQAGLLLLLECEWEAALAVLEELDVAAWQPCQLFGLFPAVSARCVNTHILTLVQALFCNTAVVCQNLQ